MPERSSHYISIHTEYGDRYFISEHPQPPRLNISDVRFSGHCAQFMWFPTLPPGVCEWIVVSRMPSPKVCRAGEAPIVQDSTGLAGSQARTCLPE